MANSSAEARKVVETLTAERDSAREAALGSEKHAEVVSLTDEVARLAQRGKPAEDLRKQRDELKALRDADVTKLQAELATARAAARAVLESEGAEALSKQPLAELAAQLAELTAAQKLLKAKKRAVRRAMNKQLAALEMSELWKKLSDEEKASLLSLVNAPSGEPKA